MAKAWDYHVRVALGISNEENLEGVAQSIEAVVASDREAMLDCEHFFDGYKANRAYALAVAPRRLQGGRALGGAVRHQRRHAARARSRPSSPMSASTCRASHLGIHTHNDTENAVANTLAAVRAGARQIQGALNGLGERCGNANLASIIPTLLLKSEFADRFETSVTPERLRRLTHASRLLDEVLNRAPNRQAPYVGEAAFATKAGIHASAILKEPATYEHVPPESVGNRRRVLVSDQAGKSNLLYELERLGVPVDRDDPRIAAAARRGEGARGDRLRLRGGGCLLRAAGAPAAGRGAALLHASTASASWSRSATTRWASWSPCRKPPSRCSSTATTEPLWSVAEGNGPVNALDQALRKDLGRYQSHIKDVELVDYKVRILTGGTEAVTRVLVESHDKGNGRALVHGRRLLQHHRRQLRGADRLHHLQAAEGGERKRPRRA